jgi:hypothetical protein
MKGTHRRKSKRSHAKTILRLPDLDIAKTAVINSLSCPDAQRGYRHAIDEFVEWDCSEPRLSFSKTVVVRYQCTWNRGTSPQVLSTSASVWCAALHTKRQTAGFSARIWLLEYGASKASRSWVSDWATG